jgi:hypothetical protein
MTLTFCKPRLDASLGGEEVSQEAGRIIVGFDFLFVIIVDAPDYLLAHVSAPCHFMYAFIVVYLPYPLHPMLKPASPLSKHGSASSREEGRTSTSCLGRL